MTTEQTYFKDYWGKNKDVINKRRRDRYKKDRAYRSKMQTEAREHWRKGKKRRADPVDQTVVVGTAGARFGTVGRIAMLIKRSPFTVRAYCRGGVIPAVTFYGEYGARLFSENQEKLLVEVFRAFDAREIRSLTDVSSKLKEGWDGKENGQKRGG